MAYTDACVHPSDSTLAALAREARVCGFDQIVSSLGSGEVAGIQILAGVVIRVPTGKDLQRAVRRTPEKSLVMVTAGDERFNRSAVSTSGVHVLKGLDRANKHAFDHVAARSAADLGIAIEIDLAPLLFLRGRERQRVLQRYADLLVLQRHYDFPFTIASNARSVLDLRTVREIVGLCSIFGMEEEEVRAALSSVDAMLVRPEAVRVVG